MPDTPQPPSPSNPQSTIVERGKRQLLIAPRRGTAAAARGLQPLSTDVLKGVMTRAIPPSDVVKVLKSKKLGALSAQPNEASDVYVVRVEKNYSEVLKQTAPQNMIVEEDSYLDYGGFVQPMRQSPRFSKLSAAQNVTAKTLKFRIVDENDKPMPDVRVTLTGDGFPTEGQSDKAGEVTLQLSVVPGGRAQSLFLRPGKNYWDRYIAQPDISDNELNVIRLYSLQKLLPQFPSGYQYGWGQKLMGLDSVPTQLSGRGIKIGIIDSGIDNKHPLLQHVQNGLDLTNNGNSTTWSEDTVGHGTHCAGIIAARPQEGLPFRGFAPDAEVHIFKVFPGGQFSSLLEALDECMARDLDVINMSLGSSQISEAVEQKLEDAVRDGVACIVAAGNSGDNVQYPAASRHVMAVTAIGKVKEFPSEAWDSQTVVQSLVAPDGIFSPSFTCFGPQTAVCAPGVAIVSTVPGNGFEPQSGTSMAAPHITGLAALLLAHHPLFQAQFKSRGPQRVAALFNLIKSVSTPYPTLDVRRTGAGIPKLFGLFQGATASAATGTSQDASAQSAPVPSTGGGSPQGRIPVGAPATPNVYTTPQLEALAAAIIASAPTNPALATQLLLLYRSLLASLSSGNPLMGAQSTLPAMAGAFPAT